MKLYQTFYKYLRNFLQAFSGLMIGRFDDTSRTLEKCNVLFYCHDSHRPIKIEGKSFSPLVDSLVEIFSQMGLSSITVAAPWSQLTGEDTFGNVISINRSFFFCIDKASYKKDFSWRKKNKKSCNKFVCWCAKKDPTRFYYNCWY